MRGEGLVMAFRNLPTEEAAPLASLIDARPGQVSSMSFTRLGDPVSFTLLAFDEGESVSGEVYPSDTLYLVAEGSTDIVFAGRRAPVAAGEVLMVPAGVEHAVEPVGAVKLLQVSVA